MNTALIQKAAIHARKMSPTALTVVGITGVVTATVLACRATLKIKDNVLDEHNWSLEKAKTLKGQINKQDEPFPYNQVVTRTYVNTTLGLAKLYAVPFAIGVVSIACIAGGHVVLLNRNAALGAALTATEKAFSKYRGAVKEKYGEEAEREIHYSVQTERIENTKDGKVEEIKTFSLEHSPYAKIFDESNPNWDRSTPSYGSVFLLTQQNYANQRLRAHGYLLLNDVYKALGFPKTSAGAVVGWALGHGDDYVDFGLMSVESEGFVEGDERSVLLDFNVAGSVFDLIDQKEERF